MMRRLGMLLVIGLLTIAATYPPSSPTFPEQGTEGHSLRTPDPGGLEGSGAQPTGYLQG